MKFCRRIARQLFFEKQKADKRHIKELRKGSVHNLLTSSLQKILLSTAGLSMLVSPLFGASQSKITALGNQTTIDFDSKTKIHTITTTLTKGENAFNAFKDFTLHSNEIANLKFPENTKNLLNFVRNKIDIQGTLNAVKDSRIGGNLYFLSSEGLILGKGGVINAGAFYAMTPTKGFMDKFIGNGDSLDLSRVDNEISYIVDRKISNHNAAYDYGVTINPYGEIQIEGKINTINGIGLYAGGFGEGSDAKKKGLYIGKDAVLNSLDASGFSSVVNVSGLSLPQATDIVEDGGSIELVSVQDNTHNSSKILELVTGYSSFVTASAAAKIESYGKINSRSDVSLTAYASNGHVSNIKKDGTKNEFDQEANLADIYSTVVVDGEINAEGDISVTATSDNINNLKTPNLAALGLELMGTTFSKFPLNIDANVLVSNTTSYVDVRKNAKLEADGAIEVAAITNSTVKSGAKSADFTTDAAATSNFGWLPIIATGINIAEAKAQVDFDGKAKSKIEEERAPEGEEPKKSISIKAESNSVLSAASKAKTTNTRAGAGIAFSLGKHDNKAILNIGKNAGFEAKQTIELSSLTTSENSVTSFSSVGKTSYAEPAVSIAIFDSEATANVEAKIDVKNQVGKFIFNVVNTIDSDELSADSGITAAQRKWADAAGQAKKQALNALYEKLHLSSHIAGALPDANASKFSIAGSVAYGGGTHSANLNIKSGASIKTTGDLNLSSEMSIMDTHYSSTADMACSEEHEGSKFSTSIAFLYNDYDYSSNILIDDSSNPKTEISGKNVSIESTIYQPYRRPEAMVNDLKDAWEKVGEFFTSEYHKKIFKKVSDKFDKLFTLVKDPSDMTSDGNIEQTGQVWREVCEAFDSVYETIIDEAVVTENGIVGRLIDSIKAVLEFKEYTNYVNVAVASSVSTDDAGDNQPFAVSGSVYIGNNKAKSNIFGGKNVIIKSADSADIDISSKADVTTTTMVGGIPVLYNINSAKSSAGAAVLIHRNNSESNILMANGASIGNAKTGNININTANLFKPIELVMGTSSASNGFNGMASAIDSKSYSNIRLDDGVSLSGDTIKLDAYNNTEATNIVGALTLTEKKGIGVGLAITLMDKESQILIQDNDSYWQNIRKDKGLSGSTTSSAKVASITADIVEAVAKTTGTINSIGVAGAVAIDDKSKYDNFSDKACMVNEFVSGNTLDSGTNYLKYKLLGKILKVNVNNNNVPAAAPAPAPAPGAPDTSLSLTLNGSAAANSINNTTKVAIENTKINFKGKSHRKLDASAINSAHHLSFAGAAGLMAQGDNGAGKSVGVDGSVAVNNINNTTETLINKSEITYANQVNATAINGGDSIAAALGLQVIVSSQHAQNTGSGAINGSVNLIDNTVSAKVKNTNASSSGSGNNSSMVVAAYEADTQVTGGISAAVGKQKGGVGLSIDVAKIDNKLTAEIDGGKMTQMKNVEVNALQASTIVNAGIALALSVGVDQGSFGVSGSGVYTELNNTNSANIKNATINSDAVSVRTQDVRTSDSGVKTYNDNLERNAKDVSFIDKEGKEFYTGLDTATGTTELGELASSRKGSLLVTAAISGAGGGTAVGLGAAINEIGNTYNVNVDKSNITTKKFNANAITHTDAITVGIGASVSTEANKGSGAGSAGWNSIKNEAKVTFSNNTIKSETLDLKSLNDASLIGVGGQVSVSKGYAAIGASIAYNAIENTASSKIYGGSVTGTATNTSKLSVNSENTASIWGIAVSVEVAKNVAVGGTVVVNEIDNNATSAIGDSSTSTKIASIKEMNILATDSADIKGLSGAVTASKKVSLGGAVTVNHIEGETAAKLNNTTFNALNSNVRAYSESNNLSLALGCGGAGTFAFDGAAVNNDIYRDVYVKVDKSTTDNASATFNSSATAIGNTGSLAAVVLGGKGVSVGAGVSVNRMGGKVQTTFDQNNFKVKNLSAISFSNQDITTIGIAGSAGGVSISGSIAYNAIEYNTIAEILNSTLISATNNIAVKAISDDTIKNYAGVLSLGIGIPDVAGGAGGVGGAGAGAGAAVGGGAAANRNKFLKVFDAISGGLKSGHDKMGTLSDKMGGVGVGVSVSVNKIDGKTNAKVSGGNVTAQGKDANDKVKLNNQISDSDINNKYVDSSTIDIKSSLADKRKETTKTGLVIDSSSTHTTKSFLASVSGGGKAGANANVNVNYVGGETNASFENATVNKGLTGKTAGNVNVNASDYTNTAGFIGNVSFGGTAGIGLSADANKVVRTINSKVSGIKDGSVADKLEVKANSKQGISSVVAGLAASLKVGVAGNVDVAILSSTTKALVENSKISVNSLDVEANHYARAHEWAVAAGIGVGTAGVGAAVVVNNDINTVSAGVASSTINANSGSNGAFKVNSKNDDDFETVTGAGGGGVYAGVAGAVAVDYMENNVETTVASSTFGNASNRAGSVEIKAKDLSKQVSKGGSVGIGGYAGVGAVVEVNTLDGQTNTNITNSKIYATNDIDLGASERRDSEQFAVSVSAGMGGVGANVLVINSGKKLDVKDSGSNDANNDIDSAMNMADTAASSDYLGDNYYKDAFTADEINTIFKNTPSYTASKDGKAVTLTKIDKSTIDSKSGKISSLTTATGSLVLSNNGAAAGLGGVMGTFGYIYDNKNVVTTISNSIIKAKEDINHTSSTYGFSDLSMFQGSAGIGDYSGAFAYVNMAGKNSLGIAGSTITSTTDGNIILQAIDHASGKTEATGIMVGGAAIGTIIAKAKNSSYSDVTIGKSKITNSTASGTINILSEKNNSLEAIGHAAGAGIGAVSVVSTLAQDIGSSTVNLGTGNTFKAYELNANANNLPVMASSYTARSGAGLGVGVGDVTAREYGSAKLIAQSGSRYEVGTVNLGALMSSTSNESSSAHTYSLVDIKANRVDSLSASKVDVIVNIGKNNYNSGTVLNVNASNRDSTSMDVDGQSGGVVSVANSLASATANLTTNLNITGAGDSTKLGEINAISTSEATHKLYANGDGGGVINVSPYAAEVDSTMNLNSNTKLAGNLSADKTKANAIGRGKSYTTALADQGSIVGGFGVQTNSNINAKTYVTANDNVKINGDTIELATLNDFVTGPERKDINVKGRTYGGITGNNVTGREKINSTSEVKVGKKASLIAKDLLNLDAKTKTDLHNSVFSGGAGLGIHIVTDGEYDLVLNNNIVTNAGSLLRTENKEADVNLATSYDFLADYSTTAEVFGSGGGSTNANTKYNITANNKMDLSGDIYSYNDINMYTDRDTDGVGAQFKLKTEAEAYTKSVIAWTTSPKLKADIKLNNNINVNKDSLIRSIRHTKLFTDNGDFKYTTHTKRYTWYNNEKEDTKDKSFTTIADGVKEGGVSQNNSIKVDGKVIAGVENKVDITIDGKVVFDKNTTGDGIVRKPTISCTSDEYKDQIKYGTLEYANRLYDRYLEIENLIAENAGTIVGENYKAEKDRLIEEMKKYGLYDTSTNSLISKMPVDYIELPNIVSSGGNVYLNINDGKKVTGNGLIQAKGAPEIKVNNNSTLYMVVNDLSIIEPGGDIVLNNLSLGDKAKSNLAVKEVKTDSADGSLIDVKENWDGSFLANYYDINTKKTSTLSYTPLSNIEINGHIDNPYGNVNFLNASKDIVIQGKTAKDSASIKAAAISISAPKGSIAQGYTQGITNIGYSPEYVLREYYKAQESQISKNVSSDTKKTSYQNLSLEDFTKYEEKYKTSGKNVNDSSSGVWLAGGSIFLNGDNLNINGTVQSGYSQFEANLGNSDAVINAIKTLYQSKGSPEVTDAYLKENCKLNKSGMLWDESTGTYKYVVQAYYNPKTDKIILEDITSEGGKIYLTGRISNTSNGKIYAADGSSDINIVNNTGKDLIANILDVGEREGFIRILDLAKTIDNKYNKILGTLTEMTSKDTKVWYIRENGQDEKPSSVSGVSTEYKPKYGLTYNWSTGYQSVNEYTYNTSENFTVWGLIDYGKQTWNTLQAKMDRGEISPKKLANQPKQSGTYIGDYDTIGNYTYSILFENKVGSEGTPSYGSRTVYDNWTHFSGTVYSWATIKKGNTETYKHSIKADYPIKIGFLSGKGDINLTTNSNLTLNSDVTSKKGKVKLTSTNGYIEQLGGNIYTDNLWLDAVTGIASNKTITQYMQSEKGVLSAQTKSGDINLISFNKAGLKDAELEFTATTDNGNVKVTTDASMIKSGNALDVKGSRIDLVSNYGSIGKSNTNGLLSIYAGQEIANPGDTLSASVNAKAVGSIGLNQTNGDLRIGRIESQTGDVYIKAKGTVIDALPPSGNEAVNKSAENLIAKWKQMGIISEDGNDNSDEKKQEAIEQYKKGVETSFNRYLDLKKDFEKNNDTDSEFYSEYQSLKEKFGNYATFDKWLEAQSKDKNSDYYGLLNVIHYGWTQDSLLYAIQDSIINKEEGSTVTPKDASDANIKGWNITIEAGGGVGRDEGYTVYDISDLQSEKGIETLKAIAAAEASDVKWGYDGDKVDENKATINKVNSIAIDASGKLAAYANDNIYIEEVNDNEINLISVSSDEGNVRIYGNKGIYNATNYREGNKNNTINIAGKDLIVEGGTGSIGRSNCPVTTNMSGAVTARCDDIINIYQIGSYALTFAAAYSGADINIRSIGSIYSVYNGVQADELGYINAKGNITLLSDKGDIGQANGKGLRVNITDDKELTAEGNSVYIKGFGENTFNLDKITARTGDIGIDSNTLDVILKNDISSQNLEFKVRSLTQEKGKLTVSKLLNVTSDNGINLGNFENLISEASLINNKSGKILLNNNHDLTIFDLINKAESSNINIINEGFVTVKNGFSSNGNLFIWADGNIDIQKDSAAKNWIGLYSDEGGITVKTLKGGSIDISAETNGLSADDIISNSYIEAYIEEGDINTGNLKAENGKLSLITNNGSISSKNIEANNDVNVIAYNGKLEVDSIKSLKGDLEAVGYESLTAKSIIAQNNFYVGSLGDVVIKVLSAGVSFGTVITDLFDDFKPDELASNLLGKNINIENINILNNFEAIANGNFNVNKIVIGKKASISAEKNIDINNINSGENLEITSFGEGSIKIKDIYTDKGELSISNEIGNIELENINAGNDVQINNGDNGDISIGQIKTSNEGSLYANLNDGIFCLESGVIDGEASIYSEKGNIVLTEINVDKELDVRANDGSIVVGYKTTIGGDATLKSNTNSVLLTDAEVGGNMKISAYSSAYINNAKVYGSMLMKGVVDGCTAAIIEVGNDLILNTDTGSIKVKDANVGSNSYVSIDGKGKDIEISNINTGNVSTGDLIIVSNSAFEDNHTISIDNAIAANKLIINSLCSISLNSAFANNGKLEVKAGGNVFAELIKSAKETYISTLFGILEITKVISGDTLQIAAFGGSTLIKDIETLNPEADIIINQILGDISISNASSSRNLEFTTFYGGINIDTVSTAKDIKIDGFSTEININNSYAGNDVNINNENGKIDINNTQIGNNLNVSFAGDMKVKDVQVGNKSSITIIDNSILNIDKFKSSSLDIIDKAKSILDIADSNIDKADIKLGSNAKLADSTINSINATIGGDLTVNNLTNSQITTVVTGKAEITDLTSNELTAQIGGNTNLTDSKVGKLNAEVKGDTTIKNVENSELAATIEGITTIEKLTGNKTANLNIKKDASIKDSDIGELNSTIGGYATISNLTNDLSKLNVTKDATIEDSSINTLNASIEGNASINNLTNDSSELTIGKEANISNSTINNLNASIEGNTQINNLVNSKLTANIGGDAEIANLTSNDMTANIGGYANIADSSIEKMNAEITGDTTLTNLVNSELTANISGKAEIEKLTGNKSAKLTVSKDTKITNSSINSLTVSSKGNTTISKLTNNSSSSLTVGKDAKITDSIINNLNASIGGSATIDKLVNNLVASATIGGEASITNSTIDSLTAKVTGNTTIDNLTNKQTNANIDGYANISDMTSDEVIATIGGNAQITDSNIARIDSTIGRDLTVNNLTNRKTNSVVNGNADITKLTSDEVTAKIDKNASIADSTIGKLNTEIKGDATITNLTNEEMTAILNGKSSITDSKLGNVDLTNNGEALIKDSTVNTIVTTNSGNLELTATPVDSLNLSNSAKANASIHDTEIKSMTASNDGELYVNKLTGDKLELTSAGNTNIDDSKITNINANISGQATIIKLESGNITSAVSGKSNISDSSITKYDLTNTGESIVSNSEVKNFTASNDGELDVNKLTGDKLELTSAANTNIDDSKITNINANISGQATINKLETSNMTSAVSGKTNISDSSITKYDLTNTGESIIKNSNVNTMVAANDGKLEIAATPVGSMSLTNKSNGNASIHDSTVNSMIASNDGELEVNKLTGDKLELTSAGNTNIDDSKITNIKSNISGNATVNKLESSNMTSVVSGKNSIDNSTIAKLNLTNSGETSVTNSSLTTIIANNSGNFKLSDTTAPVSSIDITSSGKSTLKNIESSKIKLTNSGNSSLTNLDVTGSGYLVNKNGNMNIDQLDVANNLDLDSNGGSIGLSGIDVNKDFNFALAGNSGVKFKDIIIGNDFNVYAGKAVLNGSTLNIGNNMNTYTYSKYSAPKTTVRAAVKQNSGTAEAKETDEGFTLILDELNIGGGLYVDNPDVTIKVKESSVGHDVDIDAGKENIQIDKLDVDGGSLDIKGDSGAIKLGEVKVDNDTNINLGSGNLDVASLTSTLGVDLNVGGSITSGQLIKTENSTVNAVAGGNITVSTVEAKGNIDFNAGGSIVSDNKIETETESVNMIAGGGVDAYKVLAKQQGNIEAVNGDIIIGQINGKTLVFREDSNDRTLRVREANVESKITASADYIDIDLINQNPSDKELGIDFTLVNGRAMDNVIIRDVKTDKGVNMNNLVSTYGNVHVSNEIFNLTKTYLLKMGDLSNTKLKFRLFGDNPVYTREPDIIAFFAPRINHKSFADISFTNVWAPDSQDYYPLIAKGDYKRMFNQYTVVQEYETIRLAYEERIEDIHDYAYSKFNFRNLTNSKSFFMDKTSNISSDEENVNLDCVEVPVGLEFDSANGELKAVGSKIIPHPAID